MAENFIVPYIQENIFNNGIPPAFPKSPLRYPGGKARAVNQILRLFPGNQKVLVSPFFGGGSVEIAAAAMGMIVFGYDIFPPLVNFWVELLKDPNQLADKVLEYFPLSKDKFYELQKLIFSDRLESAAVFYVLN